MIRKLLNTALMLSFSLLALVASPYKVFAASGADWKAGNIIDDSVFFNNSSMSAADVQNFLSSQVPSCDTWGQKIYSGSQTRAQWGASIGYPAPFVCLRDYQENPTTHENNLTTAGSVTGGQTAAQIIKNAADTYKINPKVLITLLQKEQGLITDSWPLPSQYRSAMGYGCPDTAPCNAQYYGLYNQVNNAAAAFRRYADNPQSYRYKAYQDNTILYNPNSSCGSSTVSLSNQATANIYIYTPYQPNQAALNNLYGMGDSCSAYGNRNFWRLYSDWFGSLTGPAAFTVQGSSQIYVPIGQYKYIVPYAAAMQDYGISWDAIQNVSQQYVDSIPSPPVSSGLSSSISHVIKSPDDGDADGGSIYLISRGKRYQFQSMQQFYNFGFKESDISYLPLNFIFTKQSGGMLPNFISEPRGSVFQVDNQGKHLIFDYSSYIARNPDDQIAALSYFLTDKIPSSLPVDDKPVLIKYSSGDSLLIYAQGQYSSISTYDVYQCWGFETTNKVAAYRLSQNDYIAPVAQVSPLACANSVDSKNYVLNSQGLKIPVPSYIGLPAPSVPTSLVSMFNGIPDAQHSLSQYVKVPGNAAVWYLSNGKRRVIPTYNTFRIIGLSDANLDFITSADLSLFPYDGLQLAKGQLVKDPASSAVYIVGENKRFGFPTSDLFLAYRNSWGMIDTIDAEALNKNYPVDKNVSSLVANKSLHTSYVIASNGCFILSTDNLSAFGQTQIDIENSLPYSSDIFTSIDFTKCKSGTNFLKVTGQSVVYWLSNGKKYPLATYTAMLTKNGGIEPTVMTVDTYFLGSLPAGSPLY